MGEAIQMKVGALARNFLFGQVTMVERQPYQSAVYGYQRQQKFLEEGEGI